MASSLPVFTDCNDALPHRFPGLVRSVPRLHPTEPACIVLRQPPGEAAMLKTAGINHIALVCRDMRETTEIGRAHV